MIPTIKEFAPDKLPTSDKSNFLTKNKCILNIVQQASNKIPVDRKNQKQKMSVKEVPGYTSLENLRQESLS